MIQCVIKKRGGEWGVLTAGKYWEGMGRGGGKNKECDLVMIIFYQVYIGDSKNNFKDKQKLNKMLVNKD